MKYRFTIKISNQNILHININFFCIFFTALILFSSGCLKKVELPLEYSGIWITDDEQYEERFIELGNSTLTFGTGAELPDIYVIQKTGFQKSGNYDEYTFTCVNTENTEFKFILYFENNESGLSMRLNNPRQVVWIKSSEDEFS